MTITPGSWNLTIYQGGTFTYTITWTDQNNALINLTGYAAELKARSSISDTLPFLDMTSSNGQITLGGAAGTVTLTLTASQTAALPLGTGVYDLKMTSPSGNQDFLLQGSLTIQLMSTR